MKKWRWMLASKIGTGHLRNKTPCQDAGCAFLISPPFFSKRKDFWFCAIVSDGAGSTSHGGEGARIVCRFLKEKIRRHFKTYARLPPEKRLRKWIFQAREEIKKRAGRAKEKLSLKDFACTLVLFLSNGSEQISVHIGDGAVALCSPQKEWECFSAPENGEYASTTYFLTDERPKIRFHHAQKEIKAVCVFSDGLEGIALKQADNSAHQPFFDGLSAPLEKAFLARTSRLAGCDARLSKGLGALLESEKVCARTDDDKTLILAVVK